RWRQAAPRPPRPFRGPFRPDRIRKRCTSGDLHFIDFPLAAADRSLRRLHAPSCFLRALCGEKITTKDTKGHKKLPRAARSCVIIQPRAPAYHQSARVVSSHTASSSRMRRRTRACEETDSFPLVVRRAAGALNIWRDALPPDTQKATARRLPRTWRARRAPTF